MTTPIPLRRACAWAASAFAVATFAGSAAPALAAKTVITSCGQSVSGKGVLAGDLDCTGFPTAAVLLAKNATLDLSGFTLSGGDAEGVICDDACKVVSSEPGGTLSGFAGHGVVARGVISPSARVRVSEATISGNGGDGVLVDAPDGQASVRKATISGNGGMGVFSPRKLHISKSTITGNTLEGGHGKAVKLIQSEVSFNGTGIVSTDFIKVDTADITDNVGDGIQADISFKSLRMNVLRNGGSGVVMASVDGTATIFFSEISDNGVDGFRLDGPQNSRVRFKYAFLRGNGRYGVNCPNFRLALSRADDNGIAGAYAPAGGECKVRIDRFSVFGNGTDPSCGVSVTCADIASCEPLLFFNPETACDTSYDTTSGFPGTSLGICSED